VENLEQFSARVSPIREDNLFFKRSGHVKVVYVERGEWVEEGTLIAEIELEDLLNQLGLAEVDLQSAQKRYETAVEEHQRQMYSAEMNLDIAELRLERALASAPLNDYTSLLLSMERTSEAVEEAKVAYKEALDRPWEPQRVRDSLLRNITNAERNYTEAQARYRQAVREAEKAKVLHDYDTKLLEMEVTKNQQQLEWLKKGVDPVLEQSLQSAQLKVGRLEDQVATGQLVAPIAGEITSLNISPGRAVEAHKTVVVIADPNDVNITADLTSNQLSVLEEGQSAEITMSSAPGKVFEAVIEQLPYPYGTGGGQAKVEDQDERVHITMFNPEEADLEVGDLVKVTVMIEQSGSTLWLPPAAIRTFEGRKFVMVKVDDRLQKVDVKLGILGEDRVEVLEGLEEGQVIEGL
jgi:multidrug efflux pump subunit AcrA (membrane-fusion protein)